MIIKANELKKYMEMHNVDRVPVEVTVTAVPECKELGQTARTLAKRLIVTAARNGIFGGVGYGKNKKDGIEAVNLSYVMYNSFKKSKCYLPPEWEMTVLTGDAGEKILKEYADHGGNLEQKFRDTFAKYNPEIQEKLDAATKLVQEAEAIAEEHGIPFSPNADLVGGMVQAYVPESYESIFSELKNADDGAEVVGELTGVYYNEYAGWQNSSSNC